MKISVLGAAGYAGGELLRLLLQHPEVTECIATSRSQGGKPIAEVHPALAAVTDELRQDKVASQFLAGIEATARELDAAFARHGVSRIQAKGEVLDPHRHQAMVELPSADVEPGTIIEEMQPGYMMKDRLLRPALVGVAKKPD